MPLIFIGTVVTLTYLSTDAGRKFFFRKDSSDTSVNNPGMQGFGYSTKKADSKQYFDEMDALRKINVQPIWEENKTAKQE